MRTLIKSTTVIPNNESNLILPSVDILIEKEHILAIGKNLVDFVPDEVIDGREMVAFPAFFNAHTHAAMTFERGWAEDLPFERWLNEKIWVAESALEEEDVYWGAALAAAEMLRSGIVGFADHYFWMDQVARLVEDCGMKANLAWCHFCLPLEQELGRKTFEDTIRFAKEWNNSAQGRILTSLGPHSAYMNSEKVLRQFADEGQKIGIGVHIHLSESHEQMTDSLKKYGLTPVAFIDSTGLFDLPHSALVAHCNVLAESDYEILKRKGVCVSHTPKTYQRLAMEIPPIQRMIDQGIRVAVGTDGCASNSDLNLLEVMRLTGQMQKQIQGNSSAMPVHQLLRMATFESAEGMGFHGSGVLAVGNYADLILLDTSRPHWHPRHNLQAGIVYTAHPEDVAYVWCNGKLLYRKGEFLTLDYERIRFEAECRAIRMVGKPMSTMRKM
jgi:5-methylthioadenosine/S-adenosylhomocysteine deaminase